MGTSDVTIYRFRCKFSVEFKTWIYQYSTMRSPILFLTVLSVGWSVLASIVDGEAVDLSNLAGQRARAMASECGVPLRWFDIYGKQPHLQEQYPDKKIDVRADDIRYGTASRKLDRPGYVYTQWFTNGGSLPIKGFIHKTKAATSTFSWSVTESLKLSAEVEISAGIPEVISGDVKITTGLNLASTQGKTKTTTEEFKVSHIIEVPPKSKVKATITITETELEVPWTATMHVTGFEAVWLEEKCNGHFLWFLPVQQLAAYHRKLQSESSGVRFEASGVFRAVRAVRATIKLDEFPL